MAKKYLVGRPDDILHLEEGPGILFERDAGTTLRILASVAGVAYGSMYIYSLGGGPVTVVVALVDTFYQIPSGVSQGICHQTTFQNAREIRIQIAGVYHTDWHMSVESASASQEVEGCIMVNGVAQTALASHGETSAAPNKPVALGSTGLIALKVGDLVSLSVLNHTGANNLTVDHLSLALERVGDEP